MIELSYSDMNDKEFDLAVRKLNSCPHFSAKNAYTIGRLCKTILKEADKCLRAYNDLIKAHCVLDENMKPVVDKDTKKLQFSTPESQEMFRSGYNVLMDTKFEIKVNKIPISDLDCAKLSPDEITAIEKIIDLEEPLLKAVE